MTWSVTHTIPYVSGADNHTAMQYLLDTYLPTKGWTTGAHPDSSAFKRVASYTFTTNKLTGSSYTIYNWANWVNTTPSYVTWTEDATYTTVPGDLATDTTNQRDSTAVVWLNSWKFCTSSVNPNAALVLNGTNVAFYWPGASAGLFWAAASWDGSADNPGTSFLPYIGGSWGLSLLNAPIASNTSTSEYALIPDTGYRPAASASGLIPSGTGNVIATNFNWLSSVATGSAIPDEGTMVIMPNGGLTDTGIWMPESLENTVANRYPFEVGGITLQVGSDYWYKSSPNLGRQNMMFNFGLTDPLA